MGRYLLRFIWAVRVDLGHLGAQEPRLQSGDRRLATIEPPSSPGEGLMVTNLAYV
jgi:hypothetical protein